MKYYKSDFTQYYSCHIEVGDEKNYYLNKKMFEIFSKFFNHILNDIKEDDDVFSAKNIIVLSQTYYTKENDKKIYLQEDVKNHDIFKNINFWEKLFNFFIEKET